MPKGVIKFFNDSRGYGFIEADETPETKRRELYVHHSQIVDDEGYRTLREGEAVTFEVREGDQGLEAVNVHRVS